SRPRHSAAPPCLRCACSSLSRRSDAQTKGAPHVAPRNARRRSEKATKRTTRLITQQTNLTVSNQRSYQRRGTAPGRSSSGSSSSSSSGGSSSSSSRGLERRTPGASYKTVACLRRLESALDGADVALLLLVPLEQLLALLA